MDDKSNGARRGDLPGPDRNVTGKETQQEPSELRALNVALEQKIQELKRTEEALRESEEKFRALAENSTDCIMRFDRDFRHLYVNPIVEDQTGIPPEQFIGKTHKELGFPEDLVAIWDEATGKVFLSGEPGRIEFRLPSDIWIDWLLVPEFGPGGEVHSVITSARDITDRKRAEEKLKEMMNKLAQSNTELEQFAYVASHDLQEPLRMVVGYLQLLERRYKEGLNQEAGEFINFAVDGARRMHRMIEDLLRYSRVGTRGEVFGAVSLEEVVQEALEDLRLAVEESGAKITVDSLPVVQGDFSHLVQLFLNLVGNAIKFRGKAAPKIHIGAKREGGSWVFFVKDNGIGIPRESTDRMFQLFQRLNDPDEYSGTGMGLAICKKIVQRHGGEITVVSKVGKGTTFSFTIPGKLEASS